MAARDSKGMTPLHLVYQKGVIRMIDFLIEKGANREAKAIYGLTLEMLHPLSAYLKAMVLKMLLRSGIDCIELS
jgi:ankyrin repeat protein